MDAYDVIIVGTGAGGGTLARHLAPSGKRILLLERGGWLPREPANWLAQDVFVNEKYISRETWYDGKGRGVPAAGATTSSAAPPSSTAPRCSGCARRTSASCASTTASRPPGRSATRSWSRTTRWPSARTRCTAPAARTRPRARRARRTRSRPSRTSRGSSSSRRPRGRGLPPVPRPVRDPAERRRTCRTAPACAARLRRLPVRGARQGRTPRCWACDPALEHPNVTLLTDARARSWRRTRPARR